MRSNRYPAKMLLFLLLLSAPIARAQTAQMFADPKEKEPLVVDDFEGHAWLDLVLPLAQPGSGREFSGVSPLFGASFHVLRMLDFSVKVPFIYGRLQNADGEADTTLRPGNLQVGGHFTAERGESMSYRYRAGFNLLLPIANLPDFDPLRPEGGIQRATARFAYYAAAAARGHWDQWLWMPSHMGVTFPFVIELEVSPRLTLRADTDFGAFVHAGDALVDTVLIFQGAASVAYRIGKRVEPSLRVQSVSVLNGERVLNIRSTNDVQLAIEPAVTFRFPLAHVTAAVMLPLDEPSGLFGEAPTVWGGRLMGDLQF